MSVGPVELEQFLQVGYRVQGCEEGLVAIHPLRSVNFVHVVCRGLRVLE